MSGESDNRMVARRTGIVLGMVLAAYVALLIVQQISRVLVWIVIAAFFAVALTPTVDWLERKVGWLRRWLATLLVYLLVLIILSGLIALFVIPLIHEGTALSKQIPDLVSNARAGRGPVGELLQRYHVLRWIQEHKDQLQGYASGVGGGALSVLRGAATTVAAVLSIFVLSYLMVLEAPRIRAVSLAPFSEHRSERIRRVSAACARTITGYITGNLAISVVCGILTYVVLLVMGVPFAGLIALFVAIADLIPLVGATLGAAVAVIAAFVHSIPAGIVAIIFFIVYQQVENHLLQPVILSRTVKLNPLTVLVSILIGVELTGILGALLAIPVAGIIQIIISDIWRERRGPVVVGAPEPEDLPGVEDGDLDDGESEPRE